MKKFTFIFVLLAFAALGSLWAQPAVFFDIRNERTETHPTLGASYAFDVFMNASYNGTYHSRGQLYLIYNRAKFGAGVNANGNVAYEHGQLLQRDLPFLGSSTPLYSTINIIDNGSDKVVFTWQSNFLNFFPNPLVHNEVPDSAVRLYTVYLKDLNPGEPAGIDIDRNLMTGQQFMLSNNDNDGNGSPDEVSYANGFLPVEMVSFSAEKIGDQDVLLSWKTIKEVNNDYFAVEKKKENGEFESLGKVIGNGTTDEEQYYTFLDETGLAEHTYYRLKQVDLDGTATYSDVAEIGFDPYANDQFVVFPSPAQDHTFLRAIGPVEGEYQVTILNIDGREVSGFEMDKVSVSSDVRIDLSGLGNGIYFVRTVSPLGEAFVNRLVKVQP
jgi:hypothetical protein